MQTSRESAQEHWDANKSCERRLNAGVPCCQDVSTGDFEHVDGSTARPPPDGSNLLHDLSRGVQVDQALVDAHLKPAGHSVCLTGGKTERKHKQQAAHAGPCSNSRFWARNACLCLCLMPCRDVHSRAASAKAGGHYSSCSMPTAAWQALREAASRCGALTCPRCWFPHRKGTCGW